MLRIAICEDDPLQLQAMSLLIARYQDARPYLDVFTDKFTSGRELVESLEANHVYDVFLLDIMMPRINGIDLAKELRLRGAEAPFVFLTASADYALDAFNVYAMQYVLKPVKEDKLFPVLDKIVSALNKEEDSFFFVSTPERMLKIPFSSVVCVESIHRTLKVYLTDGREISSKTIRVPFATAVAMLIQDKRFLQVHKSFVLNMDKVNEVAANSFIMKHGTEVPVPKHRRAESKAQYYEYLSQRGIVPAADR